MLDIIVTAKVEAARIEHDRRIEQAWLTAMLGRVKKPPRLQQLLNKGKRRARPMGWRDMIKVAEAWVGGLPTAAKGDAP